MSVFGDDRYEYERRKLINDLHEFVPKIRYKRGWRFEMMDTAYVFSSGVESLLIHVDTLDSTTRQRTTITHRIGIPLLSAMPVDLWILERIIDVERHEAMEFYVIDGVAPFFPDHSRAYVLQRETPHEIPPLEESGMWICQFCSTRHLI